MVRHEVINRNDRLTVDDELARLNAKMVIYEDDAVARNAKFSWKKPWTMLKFPEPNKMRETESVPKNSFCSRTNAFFTRRIPGQPEPEDTTDTEPSASSSSASSSEADDSDSDTDSMRDRRHVQEWKMFECYVFSIKQAFWSRIWIIMLQFIAAHWAGNRFRTDAFNMADKMIPEEQSLFGDVALHAFAGLRRWDAQHFLFIADNHYVFEHSLAFFPGFPEILNVCRMYVVYYINAVTGVFISSWVVHSILFVFVNLFFFHVSAFCLFIITLTVTKSAKRGMLAVSLLAYNPASIFFTAAYSESMYLALTLTGYSLMLYAARNVVYSSRISNSFVGVMIFGLSFCVRSNGVLNVLYVIWFFAGSLLWENEKPIPECAQLIDSISASRNERYRREGQARLRAFERKRKQLRKVFRWTDPGFSNCLLVFWTLIIAATTIFTFFGPYTFMSNSAGAEFCNADEKQKEVVEYLHRAIRIPPTMVTCLNAQEKALWCNKPKLFGVFPVYYSEIQSKYWDVGPFGYWQLKKLPCFLLMIPAAIITVLAIRDAFKDVFQKRGWYNIWILIGRADHSFLMAIHASILLFTAVFFINAEVFTRIIFSASPFLYIYLSKFLDEHTQGNTPGNRMWHYEQSNGMLPFFIFRRVWNNSWQGRLLYMYFIGYYVFGTMAHAAWLPFT